MNIGNMRYSIVVQKKVGGRDSYGAELQPQYTDYLQLKAEVKFNGGSKGVDNSEVFTSNSVQFEIYYRDITEDMQIVFLGRKYKINSVVPVGYRSTLIINAERINE